MAVALCVHSLLEGAALGAQREIAKTFHIFVAILAHKGTSTSQHLSICPSSLKLERYALSHYGFLSLQCLGL